MARPNRLLAFCVWLLPSMVFVPALARHASAGSHTIDFETPKIPPFTGRLTINPFVDAATGVRFTGGQDIFGLGEVGLVINGQTSACVGGVDFNDQKLGTGPLGENEVGLSGFPIRADFQAPLQPPCTVSTEFQILPAAEVRLRVFDAAGNLITQTRAFAGPPVDGCYFGASPRAVQRLTVASEQPIAYAIMDIPTPGYVFVIDNFTYVSNEPEPLTASLDLDPDVINRVSQAPWITAYIEPSGFAPTQIDLGSLRLEGSVPALPKFAIVGDHDNDGAPDLMVRFAREALDPLLVPGRNGLELTGSLTTGETFAAHDSITVFDPPAPPLSASVSPNPLNPAGRLTFVTSKPGPARVEIFDVSGRAVRTLLDTPMLSAGAHELRIDGFDQQGEALATGVYFYRVLGAGASARGRIVLLK